MKDYKPVVFHLHVLCGILKIHFRTILVSIGVVCIPIVNLVIGCLSFTVGQVSSIILYKIT